MELKNYQKNVIEDLKKYLTLLNETQDMSEAYQRFWEDKGVAVGSLDGVPRYQNIIPEVPNLCLKVPTGGGKTFLACNAIRPIFDALPPTKIKAVVWLVPSDSILTQTLDALRNPEHPYRQKINADFGSRVEVYTKDELLSGQNFNITAVTEQLSVMVLSYDSFRGRREALKALQENSNLVNMAQALGTPAHPLENADETALMQIINQLSPLVIVDESHHARSTLSKEMLENFNPCFILDLTATPTEESNIISYVDAIQLKKENMVKLPVIVYNRSSQQETVIDAIDLRDRLEEMAVEEKNNSGLYIRPIILFQSQPRGAEGNTTFENLRDKLVRAGIPEEQIAIKTADVNELKNINLLSPECPIRYIITVNALKEGWDCPFAYILASIANRNSQIDVEQILGRVLRQPHTRRHGKAALNMSYVLTSSNDFANTLRGIVKGLNGAGFTEKDYRIGEDANDSAGTSAEAAQDTPEQRELNLDGNHPEQDASNTDELQNIDPEALRRELNDREERRGSGDQTGQSSGTSAILDRAETVQTEMDGILEGQGPSTDIPTEVRDRMRNFDMNEEFAEEARRIKIPQFFLKTEGSLFIEGDLTKLEKEHLGEEFSLTGKPHPDQLDRVNDEMAKVDIVEGSNSNTPKVFKMREVDQRFIKRLFSTYSPEQKIRACKGIIHAQLNRMDTVDSRELRRYLDSIVEEMNSDTLAALEDNPQWYAWRIKTHIEALLEEHYEKCFFKWIETGRIVCEPSYELPQFISPLNSTNDFGKSLYKAEEVGNNFENEIILAFTSMDNIKWWHRNIARKGFCLNGFINHYPDFIVMTTRGRIILIETKGDHLENTETRQKLAMGRAWQNATPDNFRYYMVFQSRELNLDGAYQLDRFLEILEEL